MLGFEVRFNDELICSSIDSGLMEVIFTSGGLSKKDSLFIWGLTSYHLMRWYSSVIDFNKITIRIVDIERNSELIKEEKRFKTDEEMLLQYRKLKQELEQEELL